MNQEWSPWRVPKRALPPPYNRAEVIRQKVAAEDLLSTTLHPDFRSILRAFHGDLVMELNGENDNGRDFNGREVQADSPAN